MWSEKIFQSKYFWCDIKVHIFITSLIIQTIFLIKQNLFNYNMQIEILPKYILQ